MTTTTNMGLTQSTVGTTTGPDWATNAENNLLTIDAHDHTSGKGVQLTPSSLNINADLEFNLNSATELKNVVLDNAVHASASGDTNNSVYEYDGNLYWRNASGGSVQITSGTAVNTSGGSISGMTGNAQVLFSSNSYAFKFDSSLSDPGIAKISHADIDLYKYDAAGSAAKVTLKFLGTGTSAALTVPDETGTLLTTATSFAGTINVATSSSNAPINLKPNGTGHVAVGNGGASGKLTSNGAYDLVLDTNSGTNSGSITITDGADGDIDISPNGTGSIDLNSGTLDLSAQTVDVTLNGAVDALNFDSNTLSIDASNNRIGIGTASPSADLNIFTSGTGLRIDANSASGDTSINLAPKNASSSICNASITAESEENGVASALYFTTRASGGANTERMRIDSDGIITKPNMPAFVADANHSPGGYTSTSGNFPANRINYNEGDDYSTTFYRFTAPVDGVYLFAFSALHGNSSSTSRPMFFVNGSSVYNNIKHGISNIDNNGSHTNTTSCLIKLSADDFVSVNSDSGSLYYYNNGHSTFSGCLIG